MGEVFLNKTIALLASDKQKARSDALADLKHILQQNKQSSKLQSLNDKACHKIFESLFRFVAAERSLFNRATQSSKTSSRLSTCASVLRIAVDLFLKNLRTKTVRAIIDHITEAIPVPGEGLWEPLSLDYIKCLASLLRYRPHTEHLTQEDCKSLMDFCLASITLCESEESQLSIREGHRSFLEDQDANDGRSTPSRMATTPAPVSKENHIGNTKVIEEVVICIQLLTTHPTPPLQTTAQNILDGLAEFVESSVAGNTYQLAFNAINTVVVKVLFDQSELVRSVLLRLLPVIRRLWATKLPALKEELLDTLMLSMIVLEDTVRKDPSDSLARDIHGLANTLHSEYVRQSEKEILQVDETTLYQSDACQSRPVYGPRLGMARSEHNWTIIWLIAELRKLAENISTRITSESAREGSNKRQRLNSEIQDIFRDSVSTSGTKKLCALQLIPFLESEVDVETKQSFFKQLVFSISDSNAAVSSWTMVALTSIAKGPTAKSPEIITHWPQVVELTTRAFSSPLASRAACNLLDMILESGLLDYSVTMKITRSLFASANWPSALSDSSLRLWAFIAQRKTQLDPGSAQQASMQICGWLREVWAGSVTDRIQTARVAAYGRPLDLLRLLLSCTNRSFSIPRYQVTGPMGRIARTWFFFHENRELLDYGFQTKSVAANPWGLQETWSLEVSSRQAPDDIVILDLLRVRSETFLLSWQTMIKERSHITPDNLQILASFCIVVFLFVACLPRPLQSQSGSQDLRQNCESLWGDICGFLAAHSHEPAFIHACLDLLSPLPCLLTGPDGPSSIRESLKELIAPFCSMLEDLRHKAKSPSAAHDPMDLDDRFMADTSLATDETILTMNRSSPSLFLDPDSYQRSVTIQLSIFMQTQAGADAPSSMVDYLGGLDGSDLLAAQGVLPTAFRLCSKSEPSELLIILEDLGETCLRSYEMQMCETSLCICIRMMTSFVESWTNGPDDTLRGSAVDMYNWFIEVLLNRKRASPKVYIAFAGLLKRVTDTCPSYGSEQHLPSPRTSLFTILREGGIQVKFNVAEYIPALFERFLLKDHDAIFDDVLDSLPRDPAWVEGIAVRLFVLSKLASRWHTLLRRSIYHLFETPAQVPSSLWYAERCMASVSQTLGLQDSKDLFRLFSSQILYTWTETQSIMSMPFSIFGYDSLKGMLRDVEHEIVGQMIMRGKEKATIELAKYLNTSRSDLLCSSFFKAEAYSIARDISTPPGKSDHHDVELRFGTLLGANTFQTQIESHFPLIVAAFFDSLDYYEQIERAFSKREGFEYAVEILKKIVGNSTSQIELPANQQPSFRARYLLDELEFLYIRAGFDFEPEQIWTPSLVSFVCRSLLESIHPALGSLHACSVIRKIRILVCLVGPVILRDYPLEMTLDSLRPYLGDIHCSEDALGVFWYLLEEGKPYLRVTPGFTAGIAVSTLVTLRRLFSSSPESPAQEGQLRAVQSNARRFYQWLVGLFEDLRSSDWDTETKSRFDLLVSLAEKFSESDISTGEQIGKDLLFEVLKDCDSVTSLLSRPVADLVLSLLCPEIKQASDNGNRSSREDLDPASHVVSLRHTLQKFNGGSQYRLWAARIIGRSFAATGSISQLLLREQELSLFQPAEGSLPPDDCPSKSSIIRILCDMLHGQTHIETGLVERTLQMIVRKIANNEDFRAYGEVIPTSLRGALTWNAYAYPPTSLVQWRKWGRRTILAIPSTSGLSVSDWACSVSLFLSNTCWTDPVIGSLRAIVDAIPGLAVQLLPFIVHSVLLAEQELGEVPSLQASRVSLSTVFGQVLRDVREETIPHAQLVIDCILYLRNQPFRVESRILQREEWLELDFEEVALAAHYCGLHKTSLLFLEVGTYSMSGRRKKEPSAALLHDVFKNIDDPDLFYGIQQSSSLTSVMERLEYESSGFKNLLFQSAKYDSEIEMSDNAESYGVAKALNATNLRGIANTMLSTSSSATNAPGAFDSVLQAATSLQKWDIPISPLDSSPSASIFRIFQSLNTSESLLEVTNSIETGLLATLDSLLRTGQSAIQLRSSMRALGIMTEISDTMHSSCTEDMEGEWQNILARSSWLRTESYHEVGEILSWHEALSSSIRKRDIIRSNATLSLEDSRLLEARVIRQSLEITRTHGISQASLKSAMSLLKLAEPCAELGLNIDGAAKFDLANVLWDQGEMTASISMLQQLKDQNDLLKQAIPLSRAELLVTLGHHVAEARLEKPESIVQQYLQPAVKELGGSSDGEEAGRVYHGFATFCDQQLLNPDGVEDFKRIEQLRYRKEREVIGLEEMMKRSRGKEKEYLKNYLAKSKQWFDLDDREYQRLLRSREAFLQQCLSNYLLCLRESDTYNNDALRFCALWLDKSDSEIANSAVSRYLNQIPSRKFATLMNQLCSRLLDVVNDFQSLLSRLIFRICVDHPFHGMYQLFASSKSKGGKDPSSQLRFEAANNIVYDLKRDREIGPTWIAVHNVNISYVRFAIDKPGSKYKSGAKVPLEKLSTGKRLGQDAVTYKLPPPTMKIALRADCDYSHVPTVSSFQPEFTIASGVSAPKIVTAVASNGERYKQLFKGGNDDLRQDAIMEQVFEQVSCLLKDHQPTRQRNLGIRTYKVLPLTPSAGIIEFVPNTIPLHDFLLPAHQRYNPNDLKPNACRKHIADVQTKSFEQRVRTYRYVAANFKPVMKFFFTEKFNNPDDWFNKRLAYTRSTAAISILGHVLGLGDRHGHNILLDEKTGEVVHIDLGVAFEQGRVLPVPEVVPFRLTRDLVDGFGITKTEGVFRRCCEFTLEALRQESYSIMTILDVLRYDPLYSWTVSPFRIMKMQMQDSQPEDEPPAALPGAAANQFKNENEPSEADRALTVVAKKLSKTLSVTATVNELVQQATDEKNLALLYCGWAAYA